MVPDEKVKVMFWRTEFYGALTEGGTVSLHVGKIRGFQNYLFNRFYRTPVVISLKYFILITTGVL